MITLSTYRNFHRALVSDISWQIGDFDLSLKKCSSMYSTLFFFRFRIFDFPVWKSMLIFLSFLNVFVIRDFCLSFDWSQFSSWICTGLWIQYHLWVCELKQFNNVVMIHFRYAREDTRYLLHIYDNLKVKLSQLANGDNSAILQVCSCNLYIISRFPLQCQFF